MYFSTQSKYTNRLDLDQSLKFDALKTVFKEISEAIYIT